MSEKLVFVSHPEKWIDVLEAYRNGKELVCPICRSNEVEPHAERQNNGMGFATFTCKSCNKTAYFSRIGFS